MKQYGTLALTVLLLGFSALLPAADSPKSNNTQRLEQRLVGVWIGNGPCVGNSVFQS